jgi:hypothetical protein
VEGPAVSLPVVTKTFNGGTILEQNVLTEANPMSSDVDLNEIGVLKRREIEARLLAPIVDALGNKFGRQEVLEVVRDVVTGIARR